jgi:hypothetical protein
VSVLFPSQIFSHFSIALHHLLFSFGLFGHYIIFAPKIVSELIKIFLTDLFTTNSYSFLTAEKYCALLLKEIGIDSLKALQQNSKTNQCEPLITLCQKILEIFEK